MCLTTEKLLRVGVKFDRLTSINADKFEIEIDKPDMKYTYLAKMKLYFNISSIYTLNGIMHIAFTVG